MLWRSRLVPLVVFFLTFAYLARSAPGDILSAVVETNGWVLDVAINGMTTNGIYNFGLGINNSLTGNETVKLTVTSMGFDDHGNAITTPRTIYGTFALRLPYPNQAFKDQTVVSGVLTNKIVLSDYIFARDSNIVVTILAGYYTGSFSNNSNTLSAVNTSISPYQKPIANWTWPGWSRITGTNFQLRAVAFNQYAQQGRPVRLMRFISQDGHGNVETNDVLNMTLDRSVGDQLPFGEYIASVSTSPLTEGDTITNSFQAFPWIGDAPLNSNDGANAQPTPLYSTLYLLNDKTGQYGSTVAVVSPSGNDSTGVAVDSGAFNTNSPPAAFASIAGAASAIAATNAILHSRNDVGGGVVYLRSGGYSWVGPTTRSYGLTPACNIQIATFPGDTQAAINSAVLGNNTLVDKVQISNVNISVSSSEGFAYGTNLWFDQCLFSGPSAGLIYGVPIWDVTRCNIQNLQQGLGPYSTQNSAVALVRGNLITGLQNGCYPYAFVGNLINETISGDYLTTDVTSGRQNPYPDGAIVFNNAFYGISVVVGTLLDSYYEPWTNGMVFAQNIVECVTNGSRQLLAISGQTGVETPVNNIIFWQNDILGRGADLAFNNDSTIYCLRVFWSVKNNLFDKLDIKSDTGDSPDGVRTGDWSEVFGAGYSGNLNANTLDVGATGSFNPEFLGLNSFQPGGAGSSSNNWFQFVSPQSFNGITNGVAPGNYHLQANSPVFGFQYEHLLPFDLDGRARALPDTGGVYGSPPLVLYAMAPVPGGFRFSISNAVLGTTNIIQCSSNLTQWSSLATNSVTNSSWIFMDTNSPQNKWRFYRAVSP